MLSGVNSQRDVATAPSAPGQPDQESRSDLVVSHHLAGLLRRCLREETDTFRCPRVAGLLHPAANRGVRRVSGPIVLLPGQSSHSRAATYPSKDSIRSQPYRVTTALAFLTFTRRALRASRVRVAAPTLQLASRFELVSKALLCVRIRTTAHRCRCSMAYPPVGFCFPFKVLRPRPASLRRRATMDGRSASAAPRPSRSRLLFQARPPRLCPNHRREALDWEERRSGIPLVTAVPAVLSRRSQRVWAWGVTCIAANRIITDAGRALHPSRGARRVDANIAIDRPERRTDRTPEGYDAVQTPRLIAMRHEPVEVRKRKAWRMSRCGIPSSIVARSGWASPPVRAAAGRPRPVREGVRHEEVCPERKLCHVPFAVGAVAGAAAVSQPRPRLPATSARRGVHSRPSWGL